MVGVAQQITLLLAREPPPHMGDTWETGLGDNAVLLLTLHFPTCNKNNKSIYIVPFIHCGDLKCFTIEKILRLWNCGL